MRSVIRLCLCLAAVAASPLWAAAPAQAQQWCGFHANANSMVECGYSSLEKCRDAMHGKDAVCIPDPTLGMRTAPTPARG